MRPDAYAFRPMTADDLDIEAAGRARTHGLA